MSERFFIDEPIRGDRATLTGAEAHHLIHVMRAKSGSQVVLFDGAGAEFLAEVRRLGRSDAELVVIERRDVDRELPFSLVVGVALPKGDRQKWLIEKLTEVGVGRVVPLRTARSVAQPSAEALGRLGRTVIEASKQCGRNRLMQLSEAQDWADFVVAPPADSRRLLAHPGREGDAPRTTPSPSALSPKPGTSGAVTLAIGPEGGFADEEVDRALHAGWTCVDLGSRILRVETAAVVLAAWVARSLP
jgi:16S rRNA (uracil1498-N3)-methyltransferase